MNLQCMYKTPHFTSISNLLQIKILLSDTFHFPYKDSTAYKMLSCVVTKKKDKKVKVKNEMMEGELIMAAVDDEDEEMQSVASSGEEAPKPRLGGDDDDDSEEGEEATFGHLKLLTEKLISSLLLLSLRFHR